VTPPIHKQADVSRYADMVTRIHELWQAGHPDVDIADILTSEGFHSARSPDVSARTVLKIRKRQQWVSNYHRHRLAEQIDGYWTIHGLSKELGIDRDWLYRRIYKGVLQPPDLICVKPYGNYLIRNDPQLIQSLRSEVQALYEKRTKSHS
jgi:hypothetical protein